MKDVLSRVEELVENSFGSSRVSASSSVSTLVGSSTNVGPQGVTVMESIVTLGLYPSSSAGEGGVF